MKGASQLLTHSFLLAFSLVILLFVTMTFNNIKSDMVNFSSKISGREICSLLKQSIERISNINPDGVSVLSDEKFGYMIIKLPNKIGDAKYRIFLNGNEIDVKINNVDYKCYVTSNISLYGTAPGGLISITENIDNNEKKITIKIYP